MLPTFVIGLREGLEAALIVGIVAAFLRQRKRMDLLRLVWLGVGAAVVLCFLVGVVLKIVSADLPQRQQEGLETVVGLVAVAMVTYMVVWMRRNSRGLKKQLEGAAESALDAGGGALVAMAFLAVLREGFETVVFLLAAFDQAASPASAGTGAGLGIAVAIVLGFGIYRGGVRINLSKFFRATGLVLVLVAAGLLVSAAHTAHEAGWLNIGQGSTIDLTWLVQPGSVQSSLLTGMLGLQPRPVTIEVIAWLVYLIPIGIYVTWPPGRHAPARSMTIGGLAAAAGSLVAALVLLLVAPSHVTAPASQSLALSNSSTASVGDVVRDGRTVSLVTAIGGARQTWHGTVVKSTLHDGRSADLVQATGRVPAATGLPATISIDRAAALNGGRLPLGVNAATEPATVPVSYASSVRASFWLDTTTGRVLDLSRSTITTATARFSTVTAPLSQPARTVIESASASAKAAAASQARHEVSSNERRPLLLHLSAALGVCVLVALGVAALFGLTWLRYRRAAGPSRREESRSVATSAVGAGTR